MYQCSRRLRTHAWHAHRISDGSEVDDARIRVRVELVLGLGSGLGLVLWLVLGLVSIKDIIIGAYKFAVLVNNF